MKIKYIPFIGSIIFLIFSLFTIAFSAQATVTNGNIRYLESVTDESVIIDSSSSSSDTSSVTSDDSTSTDSDSSHASDSSGDSVSQQLLGISVSDGQGSSGALFAPTSNSPYVSNGNGTTESKLLKTNDTINYLLVMVGAVLVTASIYSLKKF